MNADDHRLIERDLTEHVIGSFYTVYNELGPGFLESVYENSLAITLRDEGLSIEQQVPLRVHFHGHVVGEFRADLLVERRLILEMKALTQLTAVHEVQLVNYLKATGLHVRLLLNFGPRRQFKRRVLESASIHPRSSASIRVKENNV
jgi:GxxExxY protein